MDKDNYNIDDILKEVKARRKENEQQIKEKSHQELEKEIKGNSKKVENSSNLSQNPKQNVENSKENIVLGEQIKAKEITPKQIVPKEVKPKKVVANKEVKKDDEEKEMFNLTEFVEKDNQPQQEKPQEPKQAEEKLHNNLPVDDFKTEEKETDGKKGKKEKKDKKDKVPMKKGKKITLSVIAVLLVLVIGAGVFAVVYANQSLNKVVDTTVEGETQVEWHGMDKLVENFDPIKETDASEIASFQDMIKTWYYNGSPCSSTHVLNVLVIGEDTRGDKIEDEGSRADSAIIVSINIDTKEITLTSVLRDNWAYWENKVGDKTTGQFGKINGAMATGGINCYINAVENLYKIDIDNYVLVNFTSFEDIIDELGGVTLELTSAEINEINNHPNTYGNVVIEQTFEGNSGKVRLKGDQALAYCRIRHIDSDNMRADRQKTCAIQMLEEIKDSSNVKLLQVLNKLVPYVKTGFNKNTIVQIGKYALKEGWLNYDTVMNTVPDSRIDEKGAGGTFSFAGAWIWKSDYPQDAYNLQTKLYGKSSITLAQNRVDFINCTETGYFVDGQSPVSATIYNYNYGETTTLPTTENETEEESTSTSSNQ